MRKYKLILVTIIIVLFWSVQVFATNRVLIIYHSHSGNTKIVAEHLSDVLNSNILEIKLKDEYPSNSKNMADRCKKEKETGMYPKLANKMVNIELYDTIFIGYPIWYGTFSNPIHSLLDTIDFTNKVIYTFATYETGGLEKSTHDIHLLCPKAKVVEGFGISERELKDSLSLRIIFSKINSCLSMAGLLSPNQLKGQSQMLCGGYIKQDSISREALDLFNKVMKPYSKINFKPFQVSTQVVAGLNYKFKCTQDCDSSRLYEITIFNPLPSSGQHPVLKDIRIESPKNEIN